MKTNELKCPDLRIGNYVNHYDPINGTNIYEVFNIRKGGGVSLDNKGQLASCTVKDIEPIELTEELLVKLGFEGEMYEFCLLADDANIAVNLIEHRVDISFFGNCEAELLIKYNIKYLHQLQNALYLLTNEELEVEL